MDKAYADTVRLLLTAAPDVFNHFGHVVTQHEALGPFRRDA